MRVWRRQEFSFGGSSPGNLGDGSPVPQGQAPVWGQSLPEAEAVWRHCLQIVTAETVKIWTYSKNSHPDYWPVCFTVGKLSDILELSPQPLLTLAQTLNTQWSNSRRRAWEVSKPTTRDEWLKETGQIILMQNRKQISMLLARAMPITHAHNV